MGGIFFRNISEKYEIYLKNWSKTQVGYFSEIFRKNKWNLSEKYAKTTMGYFSEIFQKNKWNLSEKYVEMLFGINFSNISENLMKIIEIKTSATKCKLRPLNTNQATMCNIRFIHED